MVKVRNVGLDTPALYKVDEEKSRIYMEDVSGITVKEYLYKNNDNSELAALIGKHLAQLHDLGIIHGDLTTSNLMLREGDISKLVFIDFGLSFHSKNDEDKAVDLYVLERALISTHVKSENFVRKDD